MSDTENRDPGWYPDGEGATRWWSGRDWTDHVQPAPAAPRAAPTRATPRHPRADDPATIWSAVGRTLSGHGGGKYLLTAELLHFERGLLSTNAQQIATWQIHDVDFSQSITQKARGIGDITLHARRVNGDERVVLENVEDFREGTRLINDTARAAGERRRQAEHTQHVNYSGAPVTAPPSATATSAATTAGATGSDLMVELSRLAAFREQGVLTEEEFTAAKARLLGL